jgi:hypothetical protein
MEGFGEQKRWGQGLFIQTKFRRRVLECSVLVGIIAIPASGSQAIRCLAQQTGCFPGVYQVANWLGKIRAAVYDPSYSLGGFWCWRK